MGDFNILQSHPHNKILFFCRNGGQVTVPTFRNKNCSGQVRIKSNKEKQDADQNQ